MLVKWFCFSHPPNGFVLSAYIGIIKKTIPIKYEVNMPYNPTWFSQRDPQWKDQKLGGSNLTLGSSGCAVTAVAMLLSGWGYNETPESLNNKLKNNGGFMGAAIVWGAVSSLYPKVRYKNLIICRDSNAPLDEIRTSIDVGQPVLLEIDFSPQAGLQTHWVVAYAKAGNDFLVLDPYPYPAEADQTVVLGQRYAHGKHLRDAISAVVWYEASEATAVLPSGPVVESGLFVQVQPNLPAGLRLRNEPNINSVTLSLLPSGTRLRVLEAEHTARAKVGILDQWLRVREPTGLEGYVAAWYVDSVSGAPASSEAPPISNPAMIRDTLGDDVASVPLEAGKKLTTASADSSMNRLVADIWNRYGGLLGALSGILKIDVGTAVAVLAIESGGQGFAADGRMIIRFENHIFYQYWGKNNQQVFNDHFQFSASQTWLGHKWRPTNTEPWRPANQSDFHGNQNNEWEVFNFARSLNDTAAKFSISMGAPQIMGFNHAAIGFGSVQDMYDAFRSNERNQIVGFFDFVQGPSSTSRNIQALQARDFNTFAAFYNGTGQATRYGSLMSSAYETFNALYKKQVGEIAANPPAPEPAPAQPTPPADSPAPAPRPPTPPQPEPTPPPGSKPVEEKEKVFVLVSKSVGASGLRMRKQASQTAALVTVQPAGSRLQALDEPAVAKSKIGKQSAWLWVKDRQEREGYVAAWLVELDPASSTVAPVPATGTLALTVKVNANVGTGGLRLRSAASTTSATIKTLAMSTLLMVLEPASQAEAKIGKTGQWLQVRDPTGAQGYVAAWYVSK